MRWSTAINDDSRQSANNTKEDPLMSYSEKLETLWRHRHKLTDMHTFSLRLHTLKSVRNSRDRERERQGQRMSGTNGKQRPLATKARLSLNRQSRFNQVLYTLMELAHGADSCTAVHVFDSKERMQVFFFFFGGVWKPNATSRRVHPRNAKIQPSL